MSKTIDSTVVEQVNELADRARVASRRLALLSRAEKDAALHQLADALVAATRGSSRPTPTTSSAAARRASPRDCTTGCALTPTASRRVAQALRDIASLPDPVGEVVRGSTLANGLQIRQMRVPMGVVGMIYEARPNVTVDAAGLGLKCGNAVILRGGSAAGEQQPRARRGDARVPCGTRTPGRRRTCSRRAATTPRAR